MPNGPKVQPTSPSLRKTEAGPGRTIVLVVAHGTIASDGELEAFLTEIRQGRPPSPQLLKQMQERYAAIGRSPLLEITRAQAELISEATGLETRVAMRLSAPRVETVLADLTCADQVIVAPMAPYSVHIYAAAAQASLAALASSPSLHAVEPYGDDDALVSAQVEQIETALSAHTPASPHTHVILTAHSLPEVVIARGDPYQSLFLAAADKIRRQLSANVHIGFQSQGDGGGRWIGPSLLEMMTEARSQGATGVVVAPVGFLTEHIETLFDLDREARGQAESLGLTFSRTPAIGTHPALSAAIGRAIQRVLSQI